MVVPCPLPPGCLSEGLPPALPHALLRAVQRARRHPGTLAGPARAHTLQGALPRPLGTPPAQQGMRTVGLALPLGPWLSGTAWQARDRSPASPGGQSPAGVVSSPVTSQIARLFAPGFAHLSGTITRVRAASARGSAPGQRSAAPATARAASACSPRLARSPSHLRRVHCPPSLPCPWQIHATAPRSGFEHMALQGGRSAQDSGRVIAHPDTGAAGCGGARPHTHTRRLRQDKGNTRPAWATLENFLKVKQQDKACMK